ncbi:carboxypeptidase-like regulatory domain-containing protein [Pedobacter sp. P26]|uniref:carboxypeptidase-like regulatory domain-containing protein n=1 Tax=Pedobacter sp. P26 TaxID=3423956 RepID=UPI003D6662F4
MKYCYAFNIIPQVLKRPLRQTTRLAKLTVLLLIATLLQVNAVSMAQTVTLIEHNAKLSKLFNAIKKQTGYNILIASEQLNRTQLVNANIRNMDLRLALNQILQNQNLTYVISNKAIIIKGKSGTSPISSSPMSYATINGLIQNEKGEALAGATISIKGSNKRTTTDNMGRFTLTDVNTGTVLVVSFVGYDNKEIILLENLSELITIKLALSTARLEEVNVVNTGYQSLSRERSAGSFSKPDMKTFNDRVGTMNIIQRLDGLIPGLTVNNAPGADQFQIRG